MRISPFLSLARRRVVMRRLMGEVQVAVSVISTKFMLHHNNP
ncbi:Uncharacterized protein pbN1_41640 [Aromatoleum bremense]|nr:Uncharacterized protein pbN1_41640 [Aromatoleum bremense]